MVNAPETSALPLAYAPAAGRAGMAALLELDRKLGAILRGGGREPMLKQMRLTWWFEALERLDREPPPAEPTLQAVAAYALSRGATGAAMAGMVDGWEALLDEPVSAEALPVHARARGGRLFALLAGVCGAADAQAEAAGEGWALADLSAHLSDPALAGRARSLAAERLGRATAVRWSRAGRGLGALALTARHDLEGRGGPARVGRLLWHRVTGR